MSHAIHSPQKIKSTAPNLMLMAMTDGDGFTCSNNAWGLP